jgi:tripartite-type tricarboxylate transporter receptor subunit TctC
MRRRSLTAALAAMALAGTLAGGAAPALAQGRAQALRFVVPYPPGGAADQITRLVANDAAALLGKAIVVENKAGAAGMIAAETVARAEPDGTTFLVGSNAPLVINAALYSRMPYDPERDFVPVAGLGKAPLMLSVRRDLPVKSLQDLAGLGAKEARKLSMGSASSGNITHLAGEHASDRLGFKVTHVPFAGSAPAIVSLLGGNIDLIYDALPSSMQQARAGKIRALAILDGARFPLLPEVPTMKELGYPNLEASAWFGLMAPAKTPAPAIAQVNKAINDALRRPELVEKLHGIGAQPMPGSPEDFGRFVAAERAQWIPVARALNLKAD